MACSFSTVATTANASDLIIFGWAQTPTMCAIVLQKVGYHLSDDLLKRIIQLEDHSLKKRLNPPTPEPRGPSQKQKEFDDDHETNAATDRYPEEQA